MPSYKCKSFQSVYSTLYLYLEVFADENEDPLVISTLAPLELLTIIPDKKVMCDLDVDLDLYLDLDHDLDHDHDHDHDLGDDRIGRQGEDGRMWQYSH